MVPKKKKQSRGNRLTFLQEKFVAEYLVDLNLQAAAARAGYSKKNASSIATQLLRLPLVKGAIETALQKRIERTQITADWVLKKFARRQEELEHLNRMDAAVLYDEVTGALKPIHEWPIEFRQKQMIRGFKVSESTTYSEGRKLRTETIMKEVLTQDFATEERKNLEMIGRHTRVGAYKDSGVAELPKEVTIRVQYVNDQAPPVQRSNGKANGQADESEG